MKKNISALALSLLFLGNFASLLADEVQDGIQAKTPDEGQLSSSPIIARLQNMLANRKLRYGALAAITTDVNAKRTECLNLKQKLEQNIQPDTDELIEFDIDEYRECIEKYKEKNIQLEEDRKRYKKEIEEEQSEIDQLRNWIEENKKELFGQLAPSLPTISQGQSKNSREGWVPWIWYGTGRNIKKIIIWTAKQLEDEKSKPEQNVQTQQLNA